MKTVDFEPQIKQMTIIYDKDGNEITTLDGIVSVKPKDYEDYLPVEYRQYKITTELLNVVRIEKQK